MYVKLRLQLYTPDSKACKEDGGHSAGIWNSWKNSKRYNSLIKIIHVILQY